MVVIPSAKVDVKGTEPVSRTVRMPSANNVKPRERQKYSSSARAPVSDEGQEYSNSVRLYAYG